MGKNTIKCVFFKNIINGWIKIDYLLYKSLLTIHSPLKSSPSRYIKFSSFNFLRARDTVFSLLLILAAISLILIDEFFIICLKTLVSVSFKLKFEYFNDKGL